MSEEQLINDWLNSLKPNTTFDVIPPVPDGYEMRLEDIYGAKVVAVDATGVKPTLLFDFRSREFKPMSGNLTHPIVPSSGSTPSK